jgi:DNA (cytosine-5)-methyltransferase 1
MNELSLFTGIGGGVYGTKLLNWKTIGYVEYDNYCQRIIAQRIKDGIFDCAPIFSDIRTFASQYARKYRGLVDVVTAGFPCQPFSSVGNQRAAEDSRNMWPSTLCVLESVEPQYALLENVPGLLGGHGYFGTILCDLAKAGFDAKWGCLSAATFGALHKRERLWIVATNTKSGRLQGRNISDSSGSSASTRFFTKPTRTYCRRSEWWATEPAVGRVADGIPNWGKRLKALGNAQVPIVAAEAWKSINNLFTAKE